MSNLRKFEDEEDESKYGRVYAVSGPGELIVVSLIRKNTTRDSKPDNRIFFSFL